MLNKVYMNISEQFWVDMQKSKNKTVIVDKNHTNHKFEKAQGIASYYYYTIDNVDRNLLLQANSYVIYYFDNGKDNFNIIHFKIEDRAVDENNNLILIGTKEIL